MCHCNVSASVAFTPPHYNRVSHYTNSVPIKIIHLAYNRSQYHHMFVATVGASIHVVSFNIFRAVVMRDALVALWWTSFATIQVQVSIVLVGGVVFVYGIVIGTLRIQKGFLFLELFFLSALYIEPVEEGAFSFS